MLIACSLRYSLTAQVKRRCLAIWPVITIRNPRRTQRHRTENMYQYDQCDQQVIDQRVAQYRDQTRRYLAGELTEAEFRPLRLRNGLYIQRLAPMLRVAIPYGLLSSRQLRMLAHIAQKYDKGYGHFSTRQNIQFNWPTLESVPDILADLATVQMHAIQTSGNCIRNITADQYSGAAHDERVDARPYCELIRQWSTFHPEFDWLPRKFKIAVNGSREDRAATNVHDIGLDAYVDAAGQVFFDVKVGGGLGRTPVIGSTIRKALPVRHLLSYLEAILRIYNRYGRRDNLFKARIKILVRAMTPKVFAERVDAEWEQIRDGYIDANTAELARIRASFHRPRFEPAAENWADIEQQAKENTAYGRWLARNLFRHKEPGYAIVVLSLKRIGNPPGDATDAQMFGIAALADHYSYGEVRVSHEQNLILPHVKQDDLPALFAAARSLQVDAAVTGTLADIVCCPGGDFCSLANAKSIPVAEAIQRRFDDLDYLHDLGDLKLNISGCMNACGHHHVGHIGILGVDKKGKEFYQVSLGGDAGQQARLGDIIGPSFSRAEIPSIIEKVIGLYVQKKQADESFLACYQRIGLEPFKEVVYGTSA